MGWIHDTGYDPAYDHEGWTASVLDDGSDTGTWPPPPGRQVTGWRSACECGWRGPTWPRAEWPSADGWAPERVEDGGGPGEEGGQGGCHSQWQAHLREALPDLAVHDAACQLEAARAELDAAVIDARAASISWERIGTAAGLSRQSAHVRWDHLARESTEPVALDGEPAAGPLDSFAADITRRCEIARRRHGAHPARVWSTSERLAVALVLRDWEYLKEMGYTSHEAEERIISGMPGSPRDFGAWLDRIRAELNGASAAH